MEPLKNNAHTPFIFSLFFLFCFWSAEVECLLPYEPSSTPPTDSQWLQRVVPSNLQGQKSLPFPRQHITRTLKATVASWPTPPGVDPVVHRLCNVTDYSDLCFSSLKPFPAAQRKRPIDDVAVLKMLIKACSMQIEQAMDVALKLYPKPHINDRTAKTIVDCKELYSHGLDDLRKATMAVDSKDLKSLRIQLSAAINDAETCEDGFEKHTSPLAEVDRKIQNMAGNCLAVASVIKW